MTSPELTMELTELTASFRCAAGEDGLLRRPRLRRDRPLAHRFGGHGYAQAEVGGSEDGAGLVG